MLVIRLVPLGVITVDAPVPQVWIDRHGDTFGLVIPGS